MEQVDIRITRLKLVNYLGIYHGMKKDEFEITFPDNGNAFTMFLGKNGSGKTTIISQLQPFADSFDDRKDLIIEGREGIKELDIETRDHSYKIKIVISPNKKKSCFIEKDGEELNKNGGLRTYEDRIKEEFGITKEFLKIAKIGSNTDTFINQTPTERKAYISNLIQNVKKYIDSFKVVADKFKVENARLNELSKNIAKYEKEEILESKIKVDSEKIKIIETNIENLINSIGKLEQNLENVSEGLKEYNFNEMKHFDLTTQLELKKLESQDFEFKNLSEKEYSIEECEEKLSLLLSEINEENNKLNILTVNLKNNKERNIEINNNISRLKYKVKGNLNEEIKVLEEEYNNYVKKEAELSVKLKTSAANQFISGNEMKISNQQVKFKQFIDFVLSNYAYLNGKDISEDKTNVMSFFESNFNILLREKINESKNNIGKTENELTTLKSDVANNYANIKKLDILAKRPSSCNINDCPFIADALNYVNLPEILKEQEIQIKNKSSELENNKLINEQIENLNNVYNNFKIYFNAMDGRNNLVLLYFIRKAKMKLANILSLPLNEINKLYNESIQDIEEAIDVINEYTEVSVQLKNTEFKLSAQKELQSNEIYFKNEIKNNEDVSKELSEEIQKQTEELNNINNNINNKNKLKELFTNRINYLNNYNKLKSELNNNKNRIKEYTEKVEVYNKLQEELNNQKTTLNNFKTEKNEISNSISKLTSALSIVKSLKEDEKTINEYYVKIKTIKESLDPRSGIPLVFIKAYLGRTEAIANELLELGLDGKFKIKFKPTSDDFFINFFVDDDMKEDISSASQGEISLTTISISLALMEQSLSKFNILVLDEIDGNLDKNNRASFINIINSQIERLGINQVFVISHNDVFDQCPMNLVLLKDNDINKNNSDYMANKTIIYDIDGQ